MPRGPARDRLPDSEALSVRQLIRRARDAKALTNPWLAEKLGWELRQVTGALDSTKPLRASKAYSLLCAIFTAPALGIAPGSKAKAGEVVAALFGEALDSSEALRALETPRRVPAMLVHPDEIRALANYLADEVARKPGVGSGRRGTLAADLEAVLRRSAPALAFSARAYCGTGPAIILESKYGVRIRSAPLADAVLRGFGYAYSTKESPS